jgi:hypothetical protein
VRLRFTLRARDRAFLPLYHGSLLRGAFGHSLRRTVCSMGPDQPCPECPLRQVCIYARWFEARIEGEAPPDCRQLGSAKPRSPSPIMWRLFPVAGQSTYLAVMTWFPTGHGKATAPVRLDKGGGVFQHLRDKFGFEKSLTGGDLAQ